MKGKNVLITGGTSGIGFETAKAIAAKGANVFIVGRDKAKAEQAVKDLIAATGNNRIKYFLANLSSLQSVRQLAAQVKTELPVLDVLVNNAGAVFPEFKLNDAGLEMTIATNHFACFLLSNQLLDLLKKAEAGRIVNVSSDSHYQGKIDFESFTADKGYFIMKAYGQSKLANVLFTQELAERLKGTNVTVNALHPGFVKTDIGTKDTNWYSSLLWTLSTRLFGITVADGAKTSVYLATSPEVEGITGKYFTKCKQKEPAKLTFDTALQEKLWQVSEQYYPLV